MFNRRELKKNARELLSKTYGMGIAVTLLFSLVGGSAFALNFNINVADIFNLSSYSVTDTTPYGTGVGDMDMSEAELIEQIKDAVVIFWEEFGVLFITIFAIALTVSMLFKLFLTYPLYVGFRRWYLENRELNSYMGTIGTVFSSGYFNIIKVMFCRELIINLWGLLFIVPGIIKSYQYRMVPFLLAENPHMGVREANRRSRELMKGNKFEAFLLDVSFIGWSLLSGFTCGLLNILYVAPYIHYTEAELYVKLCQKDNYKKPGSMDTEEIDYTEKDIY